MNLPIETEIARTDVTKFVIQYIKDNQLQSETNKKQIVPDDNLSNLSEPEAGMYSISVSGFRPIAAATPLQ